MLPRWLVATACVSLFVPPIQVTAQPSSAPAMAQLIALRDKVGAADTRVRVSAMHTVWTVALSTGDVQAKTTAIDLLGEPVGSASDHIRMPAIYAIAEIANSTDSLPVKIRALQQLAEPLKASQVPIRDVAIDAVNSITRSTRDPGIAMPAVRALTRVAQSGNNGVRIPAINALVRAVEGRGDAAASQAAVDVLTAALDASAAIGGMEVRMMAVVAMERIGRDTTDIGVKAKSMGLLQAYASRGGWEPEARHRAQEAAAAVQASLPRQ